MTSILSFKKNIRSQNGEDGIIEFIFNKIGITKGNFIEFGAWDGKVFSNSYKLFQEGWSGIYIEADETRFKDLTNNFRNHTDRITSICQYVGYTLTDNLDTIIQYSGHNNKVFDFVSIDVDGLDYFIFQKFEKYLPKVICIEVNAGHSPVYDKLVPLEIASNNVGQSIYMMVQEGEKKGYFPLCYTGNLFLIQNQYKHLFENYLVSLPDMYLDFLKHLETNGVRHLYNTFIVNHVYENFYFKNDILEKFCSTTTF